MTAQSASDEMRSNTMDFGQYKQSLPPFWLAYT